MELQKQFPWEHVNQDRNRKWLQSEHSTQEAKAEYLHRAIACPKCKTPADQLAWFYFRPSMFRSPQQAGWLTVCDQCHLQINFFLEQQDLCPWEHINLSQNENPLQNQPSLQDAKERHLHDAKSCPRCNATPTQLSWIYLQMEGEWFKRAGCLTVCNQCHIQLDFFIAEQEFYRWDVVNSARNDRDFQSQHSVKEAQSSYLEQAAFCPKCKTLAKQLTWLYFSSPEQDWKSLAGRAGWMTICDKCQIQVDFFVEIMN